MAAVRLSLVLLLASCQTNCINGDGTLCPESSACHTLHSLQQRLQLMEQRLEEQQLTMSRREGTLQQQITRREGTLQQQITRQLMTIHTLNLKITRQEETLQEHNNKITRQEETLQEHNNKITHQEAMLLHQAQAMRRLQDDNLRKTSALQTLRDDFDSLLLVRAEATVPESPETRPLLQDKVVDIKSPDSRPLVSDASAVHNRSSRSDDLDPLQATVLRLDQTVTQLTAQTQALSSKSDVMDHTVTQLTAQTQALSSKSDAMAQDIHTASASAFVRWGHAHCPDHSDLVFSGWVGGSWSGYQGAAANPLCLTKEPTFSGHSFTAFTHLLGAEYDTRDGLQDLDPVCAVCRARLPATVMVPGTDRCGPGWTIQYQGLLMAGNSENPAGSQLVCVDASLQSRPGSGDHHTAKLFQYVTSECGSLPCGPYVNNKVVSCVVCSK